MLRVIGPASASFSASMPSQSSWSTDLIIASWNTASPSTARAVSRSAVANASNGSAMVSAAVANSTMRRKRSRTISLSSELLVGKCR